jgi:phosphatidylserine/phosphatidylglycerophosphate/cardiolipin synthase-like enzyme
MMKAEPSLTPAFTLVSHQRTALYDDEIIGGVRAATGRVLIATANVKNVMVQRRGRFESIIETFAQLCRRGVEVKILFAQEPSRPFIAAIRKHPELERENFDMRLCRRNHMKLIIVDDRLLYLGSANLTGAGIGLRSEHSRNFEIGILSRDPGLIAATERIFSEVWRGTVCKACRLKKLCPLPLDRIE